MIQNTISDRPFVQANVNVFQSKKHPFWAETQIKQNKHLLMKLLNLGLEEL